MKPTILIVDDDKDTLDFYREFLSSTYDVIEANCGDDAVKILASKAVDCVLSDVFMPDGNGLRVARECEAKKIPYIFITGHKDSYRNVMNPDSVVFEKPVKREVLLSKLRDLLATDQRKR